MDRNAVPPGALLASFATSDTDAQHAALMNFSRYVRVATQDKFDSTDVYRITLLEAWSELGPAGADLIEPLKEIIRRDPSLLKVEFACWALATQGEDGITELLDFLESGDPAIRHKALTGVGFLGRGARWAVPRLLRIMKEEQNALVVDSIIGALGSIGGTESMRALQRLREANPDRAERIDGALRMAAIEDLVT